MNIKFREPKLSKKNFKRLDLINSIIEDYAGMGYKLTLRQLYYRLVSKAVIANVVSEYDKLSHVLTEGRMGGLIDWNAIEDRIRVPNIVYMNDDVDDAISDAHDHYRLDRQRGQENYIELWVEKDALSNILKKRTHYYGINLMVNRGYSSTTAMYDAYNRLERAMERGQKTHILYLGDYDPSGLDMILNDIPGRLQKQFGTPVNTSHIAITMPHIKKFNPPPNPAKVTDPRAKWYIAEYGNVSWEVDALEPDMLHEIINEKIEALMDMELFQKVMDQEVVDRKELKELPNVKKNLEAADGRLININDFIVEEQNRLREVGKKLSKKALEEKMSLINKFDELTNG